MRYLPDGAWMQKADAYTIHRMGVPSVVLMEHAAESMVRILEEENVDCSKTLIVCGSGNNGGDGFAVARLLFQKNYGTRQMKYLLHELKVIKLIIIGLVVLNTHLVLKYIARNITQTFKGRMVVERKIDLLGVVDYICNIDLFLVILLLLPKRIYIIYF